MTSSLKPGGPVTVMEHVVGTGGIPRRQMGTDFMRRFTSIGVRTVVLGLLASVALLGTAAAQTGYPLGGGPTLSISDSTVTRGQTITATVGGFQPGTSGLFTIAPAL